MIRLAAILLFFFAARAGAAVSEGENAQAVAAFRDHKVVAVDFSGDPLAENARAKFAGLAGHEFSPTAVRAALLWYHENGGDAYVQVRAAKASGGLTLIVSSRQRLKVGEIVFEGNSSVAANVLQQQIEIKDGYEFDDELAKAASQKISLFYSKQGYLASDVKFYFDNKTHLLKFLISEGEPTLLSSVNISPLSTVERKDLRERYEREILEVFGLKNGDRIQRDRVIDGIQAVKDWLRDHDFLMARDPVLDYKVSEEGRVRLNLDISYGPRIRYGFRGNTRFSYRELTLLVGEVKEVSSGSDYLSAVRRRVLEAYKGIGFANAKITTLVREDPARGIRYVSLIVSEGKKIRIENIEIEGVYSMNRDEARSRYREFGTGLVRMDFFDEEGLNRAAALFADKLRSEGYLSARLEYVKLDFNQDRSKVSVTVLFSEGVQTRVQSIEVVGVKRFTPAEVLAIFSLKEGEPFDIYAFEKGLQALKDQYREIGNLNAQIVNEASAETIVKYNKDNSQVSLRVEVDEGPAFRVGDLIVRGNKQTHARVVLREVPLLPGDLVAEPVLNEAEDNIRKLNLFSTVIVKPIDHPGAEDLKDILILVEETEPGTFDIVPGLRNDLGARLGFELGYNNLGGWNRGVNASAVFNRRLQDYYNHGDQEYKHLEYKFSLGFREPYLAEWPVIFTANFSVLRRQYTSFNAFVRRFTTGLKRDIVRYLSGFVEYGYEQIKIDDVRLPYDKLTDTREDYIGSVTPGFIVDSRRGIDGALNPFNPTKGIYSVNRFELASTAFGSKSDVGYYRTTSYNSAYMRVYDEVVLALAMNMGWERSNLPGKPIPTYKLFRLGGLGSVRGYSEDGIEVETAKSFTAALGLINYRAELRIPVQGAFGTALFIDAGNLMVDRLSFAPEKLRSSVGTGLRYKTPVGPVLLDFAWRLQSDPGVGDTCVTAQTLTDRSCDNQPTDRYKIHFAIGVF